MINKLIVILSLVISQSFAEDFGIAVPDSVVKEELTRSDAGVPYEFEMSPSLVKIRNIDIINRVYKKTNSIFSFYYILDQFEGTDPSGSFNRTYVNSSGSKRGGTIHFELDRVVKGSLLNYTYGVGLGVGLSQGQPSFVTNPSLQSNATFSLFTIPLDFRLGTDVVNGRNFKVSIAGGPSVMGLYQSRDDKADGEEGKRIRQYSFGYFGQVKAKIGLGLFSEKMMVSGFNTYSMTNAFFTLETRLQSYSNFQDPFSISGASFGLGFTFEYL